MISAGPSPVVADLAVLSMRCIAAAPCSTYDWHSHPFFEFSFVSDDNATIGYPPGMRAVGRDTLQSMKAVGKVYKLPVDNPVAGNGVFIDDTPLVAGLFVRKAEEPIIAALKDSGALAHVTQITHSYPHCWRHKTPLIFRATPQWFISMDAKGLRAGALDAIGKTQWIPGWGEERIAEMVKGRPVSERVMVAGQYVGLGLLACLMGLAFYNDILRLVSS